MTLPELKLDLISRLLSAKFIQNDSLEMFKNLLNNEFMAFANEESSLANEAEVILKLKEIEKELDIITQFPVIYKKNIISIGGAFSSGKSEFINSFLINKKYKLPVGINPVTAIPTYVVSDSQNKINGYSNSGAAVSIESEFYQKLSHDFVKSFKFNLKDIMPFITMGNPLEYFDNICFIDTPGYNPGSTDGFTSEDKSTAEEYVAKSKTLIWMMNIEDGVLQSSDVAFLESLDLTDKKLYIVANKADRIPMDSIEDTLNEIEETLDDYEIEYEGISAYSAMGKKEYHFIKRSLFDFLQEQNSEKMVNDNNIIPRVNEILDFYNEAIKKDLKKIKRLKKNVHSLELDLLQEGFEDNHSIVSDRIQEIRNAFDAKPLEKQLKTLEQLRNKFNSILEEIFETKIYPNVKEDKEGIHLKVTPLSVGVAIKDGIFDPIIKRNTPLPVKKSKTFITSEKTQQEIEIKIYRGERIFVSDNQFLGSFKFFDLSPTSKDRSRIEITFSINSIGLIRVTAKDEHTNKEQSIDINGFNKVVSNE